MRALWARFLLLFLQQVTYFYDSGALKTWKRKEATAANYWKQGAHVIWGFSF